MSAKNTILFNSSKKELFLPSSGYKTLQSRLKAHWAVGLQRDDLTIKRLANTKLVVFGGPKDKFSTSEVFKLHLHTIGDISLFKAIDPSPV